MTHPDDLLVISSNGSRLTVTGEIDAHTAPALAAAIDAAGSEVTVDMAAVGFVDSSGLRVLIDAHQRLADEGGGLTVAAPSEAVARLFEISGVDDYLTIAAG